MNFNETTRLVVEAIKPIKEPIAPRPHKKPRNQELTEAQRAENQEISGQRIFIDPLIRRLKIFRILTHRFRLDSQRYESVMLAICGLVRLRLGRLDFTNYDR
ncbi:transposase family protein [Phormidesmis sp. 146-20]